FEGDGHVGRNIYVSSKSSQLIRQVQLLLLNFGMIAADRPHRVGETVYRILRLTGGDACAFLDQIGFLSARKQARTLTRTAKTNWDTIPYLVDHLHALWQSRAKTVRFAPGTVGMVGRVFRRLGEISYFNLDGRQPAIAEALGTLDP